MHYKSELSGMAPCLGDADCISETQEQMTSTQQIAKSLTNGWRPTAKGQLLGSAWHFASQVRRLRVENSAVAAIQNRDSGRRTFQTQTCSK